MERDLRQDAAPAGASATGNGAPRSYARMESRRIHLGDADSHEQTQGVIEELLEHQASRRGKVIGLAGLPRHGKTKFAERLREHAAQRPGADPRYNKTHTGEVNIYYIPGRDQHHALVDLAGEDFQMLGQYERALPGLVQRFLWPVLQRLDGLILMVAFPTLWAGWNDADSAERRRPAETERQQMRDVFESMLHAHQTLLKYAVVAQDLARLKRHDPKLELDAGAAPSRNAVDDAFRSARRLKAPVGVAFSKADLYRVGARAGLHPPGPGRAAPVDPDAADPLMLGRRHLPELFVMLEERVRHFRFDFVQAFEDPSDHPDPAEAHASDMRIDTMVGAESMLEFVTSHPWRVPGLGTATALRIDRMLNAARWNGEEPRGGE